MPDPAPRHVRTAGTKTTVILKLLVKYGILLVAGAYAAGLVYILAILTDHHSLFTMTWTDAFQPKEAFAVGTLLVALYVTAIAPIWLASYPNFPYPNWFSIFTTILCVSVVIAINWKSDAETVFKLLPLTPLPVVWGIVWGQSESRKSWEFYRTLLWIAVGLIYFSFTMGCVGGHRRQNPPQVRQEASVLSSPELHSDDRTVEGVLLCSQYERP